MGVAAEFLGIGLADRRSSLVRRARPTASISSFPTRRRSRSSWRPSGSAVRSPCTQCAARRELVAGDLVESATIQGAASFVEAALADNVQALVY